MNLYEDKSLDERCPDSGMTYREVLVDMWEARDMQYLCHHLPQTPEQRKQLADEMNAIVKRLETAPCK